MKDTERGTQARIQIQTLTTHQCLNHEVSLNINPLLPAWICVHLSPVSSSVITILRKLNPGYWVRFTEKSHCIDIIALKLQWVVKKILNDLMLLPVIDAHLSFN